MCYVTRSLFFPHLRFNCYCNLGKYSCNLVLFLLELIKDLNTYYITIKMLFKKEDGLIE